MRKPNPYADLNQPRAGESIYDFALRQPPKWEASTLHPDKVPITKSRSEGQRRVPRRKTLAELDGDPCS